MNKLNNYLMKPTYLNDLAIYPIKLMEYEDFRLLANQYLILDIPQINNKRKQDKLSILEQDNLFDYLIHLMNEGQKEIGKIQKQIKHIKSLPTELIESESKQNDEFKQFVESIDMLEKLYSKSIEGQLCELISMTVKKKVEFVKDNYKVFVIYDDDNKIKWIINKENFYQYRKIVMEQNCLFVPRVAGNKRSQEILDREAKKIFGDDDFSLEAMVSFVSLEYSGQDISEYTYYRVKADYTMAMKKLGFISATIYRANGCKQKGDVDIEVPNLSEDLGMNINPYSKLLKQSKETELDRMLSNRSK